MQWYFVLYAVFIVLCAVVFLFIVCSGYCIVRYSTFLYLYYMQWFINLTQVHNFTVNAQDIFTFGSS